MICQRYLISSLGIGLALLVWTPSRTLAQSSCDNPAPIEINQLSPCNQLTNLPLSASEVLPGANSEFVTNEGDLLAPPPFNTVIIRELPTLWQMRVPSDQVDSLHVTYKLENDAFCTDKCSESKVKVVLEPLPINKISEDEISKTSVVQGGVRLKLDLSTAKQAGKYSGDVTITVNQ
ncbi:hypothetical protein H6G32_21595 [Cylindrospermum sp. FACHB-282]|nr:hypothetical protein [Cylindrospermum sp. FACHB-282]